MIWVYANVALHLGNAASENRCLSSLPEKKKTPYLGNEAYFPAIKQVVEGFPLDLHRCLRDGFED